MGQHQSISDPMFALQELLSIVTLTVTRQNDGRTAGAIQFEIDSIR